MAEQREGKANLLEEELHLLRSVVDILPGRLQGTTPRRWAYQGVRGEFLEVIDIGGRVYTSREALARFFGRLTAARAIGPEPSSPSIDRQDADATARATAIFGPASLPDPLARPGESARRSRHTHGKPSR